MLKFVVRMNSQEWRWRVGFRKFGSLIIENMNRKVGWRVRGRVKESGWQVRMKGQDGDSG